MKYIYVAIGAILGSSGRYGLMVILPDVAFPLHTWLVNCIGSFLLGYLTFHPKLVEKWRLIIGVGALGSFTTFSTFTLDHILLLQQGHYSLVVIYIFGTLTTTIGGAFLGMKLVKGGWRKW